MANVVTAKTKDRSLSDGAGQQELVVLVHGIASSRLVFLLMGARLRAAGYATRMWGYPSVFGSNQRHGRELARFVAAKAATGKYARIHLVVHSMGSIVTRCALLEGLPPQLGRIVMIGPPNHGSHIATRLTAIYGWISPTLVEISDREGSFVRTLPPPPQGVEFGVLAAERDRVVRRASTYLEGMRDHAVVRGHHTSSLWSRETAARVIAFLRHGRFTPEGESHVG